MAKEGGHDYLLVSFEPTLAQEEPCRTKMEIRGQGNAIQNRLLTIHKPLCTDWDVPKC